MSKLELFDEEWCVVFSKFIRSVSNLEYNMGLLERCGLYRNASDRYIHQHAFSAGEEKKIILYFLDFMVHLSYRFMNKKRTHEILNVIKELDREFYNVRGLNSISLRSKYLPAGIIKLVRSFVK